MNEEADFFISYTGKDSAWAKWIAWTLEDAGYATKIQAWDFQPASNFVLQMQSAVARAIRTLAVVSPDYIDSAFAQPEWAAAFASDPKAEHFRLVTVRIADFKPPGLLGQIVYIDLVGLEEQQAKEALIKAGF